MSSIESFLEHVQKNATKITAAQAQQLEVFKPKVKNTSGTLDQVGQQAKMQYQRVADLIDGMTLTTPVDRKNPAVQEIEEQINLTLK